MIRALGVALVVALISRGVARADGWSRTDTAYETAALLICVADWRQTVFIANSPRYLEANPILGKRPTRARVDAHFAGSMALHLATARLLPARYRRMFQMLTIGVEGALVANNTRIGIRMEF